MKILRNKLYQQGGGQGVNPIQQYGDASEFFKKLDSDLSSSGIFDKFLKPAPSGNLAQNALNRVNAVKNVAPAAALSGLFSLMEASKLSAMQKPLFKNQTRKTASWMGQEGGDQQMPEDQLQGQDQMQQQQQQPEEPQLDINDSFSILKQYAEDRGFTNSDGSINKNNMRELLLLLETDVEADFEREKLMEILPVFVEEKNPEEALRNYWNRGVIPVGRRQDVLQYGNPEVQFLQEGRNFKAPNEGNEMPMSQGLPEAASNGLYSILQSGGVAEYIRLESEPKDPYEYRYNSRTGQYETKRKRSKDWIVLDDSSDRLIEARNAVEKRYGDTVRKRSNRGTSNLSPIQGRGVNSLQPMDPRVVASPTVQAEFKEAVDPMGYLGARPMQPLRSNTTNVPSPSLPGSPYPVSTNQEDIAEELPPSVDGSGYSYVVDDSRDDGYWADRHNRGNKTFYQTTDGDIRIVSDKRGNIYMEKDGKLIQTYEPDQFSVSQSLAGYRYDDEKQKFVEDRDYYDNYWKQEWNTLNHPKQKIISSEDFYKKEGGTINKLQQLMGYKDNSPYKNLPYQNIYSDRITMQGVSQPLLAVANNGMSTIMQPGNDYYFPGATQVTEYPINKMRMGGLLLKSQEGGPEDSDWTPMAPEVRSDYSERHNLKGPYAYWTPEVMADVYEGLKQWREKTNYKDVTPLENYPDSYTEADYPDIYDPETGEPYDPDFIKAMGRNPEDFFRVGDIYGTLFDYVKSDRYLDRLKNFRDDAKGYDVQQNRLKNLLKTEVILSPEISETKKNAGGWFWGPQHSREPLDPNYPLQVIVQGNKKGTGETLQHELAHATQSLPSLELSPFTKDEKKLIKDSLIPKSEFDKKEWFKGYKGKFKYDYFSDPLEYHARLNSMRRMAYDLGIHKEFGQDFTPEDLEKIKDKFDPRTGSSQWMLQNYYDIKDLLELSKDEDSLIKNLNTIAFEQPAQSQDEIGNEIMAAQQGGFMRLPKMQDNGSVSDDELYQMGVLGPEAVITANRNTGKPKAEVTYTGPEVIITDTRPHQFTDEQLELEFSPMADSLRKMADILDPKNNKILQAYDILNRRKEADRMALALSKAVQIPGSAPSVFGIDDIAQKRAPQVMREGGIPARYKNMGFTKVGQKKQSNRPGKKWMVLAKKGNKYKVVHGGATGMSDFTKHKNEKRRDRFWDRMGGKDSAKATDPFSPLYWHKRFGTW